MKEKGVPSAGLEIAVNLLQPIADKYDDVSYADLYQMAAVTAIDVKNADWHIHAK